jgi:hypothetical protein
VVNPLETSPDTYSYIFATSQQILLHEFLSHPKTLSSLEAISKFLRMWLQLGVQMRFLKSVDQADLVLNFAAGLRFNYRLPKTWP